MFFCFDDDSSQGLAEQAELVSGQEMLQMNGLLLMLERNIHLTNSGSGIHGMVSMFKFTYM